MIPVPTAWWAHYPFDLAAWLTAALVARWQYRRWPEEFQSLARVTTPSYHVVLAVGALLGAWLFGSVNSLRALVAAPSHSLGGALAGGIAAVELWKWRRGIKGSTGGAFVLPLAVGIVVGRLGCFFSGLPDFTYGSPTSLPWAVDIGDGIGRHPAPLYEAAAMALFAAVFLAARIRGADWARNHAFHALIINYATQRFAWEFVKPYPPIGWGLNVFHVLMAGLIIYGLVWWRRCEPAGGEPGERSAA